METKKNQQQERKGSVTGLALPMVNMDANAFSILGRARAVLRRDGMADRIEEFTKSATSGDYQQLIATCCEWFDVQ